MDNTAVVFTPEQLAAAIKWGKDALSGDRIEKYRVARNYYEGEQELVFATAKFTNTFGNLFQTFAYNRCGTVVDAIADRLQLEGFDPVLPKAEGENAGANDEAAKLLKQQMDMVYRNNRLDRRQNDQIQETLKCGDAYAIVWLDGLSPSGEIYPTININLADRVAIKYNEDNQQKEYAVKAWRRSDGKWRINLYTAAFLYKFVTPEKKDDFPAYESLTQYESIDATGAAEPWPLQNATGIIPVFHFNNNASEGEYGRSELKDVIPLQDALNKACMDMMVAMEYGAFPQRWATGLQLGMPDPVTGKVTSPYRPGAGEVWTGPNGANFGTFEVANLDQFLKVQGGFDTYISNVTRIPRHWLTMGAGDFPSGESLKTAEAPFVSKLEDRQITYGNTWEDIASFCMFLLGKPGLTFNAVWKSAELRSDTDKLTEGVLKLQLGWSEDQIQREFGLEQSQIDRMKEERLNKVLEAQQAMGQTGLAMDSEAGSATMPPLRKASPNEQGEQQA